MRKFLLIFCFLFLLTGCDSRQDLNELSISVKTENIKTQRIVSAYDENMKSIEKFNIYLEDFLMGDEIEIANLNDFFDFKSDFIAYYESFLNAEFEKYIQDDDFEMLTSISDISIYSFLESSSGNIYEYVLVYFINDFCILQFDWENSKIVSFSCEWGA